MSKRLQGLAHVFKRPDLEQEAQELHVASLHRAGDPQLGLLVICVENVILYHFPAQRVCRVRQLGSWGQRSFGVQNRFFFFPFKDWEKCSQMEPLEAVADLVALGFPVPGWSSAALDALSEAELLPTALRT